MLVTNSVGYAFERRHNIDSVPPFLVGVERVAQSTLIVVVLRYEIFPNNRLLWDRHDLPQVYTFHTFQKCGFVYYVSRSRIEKYIKISKTQLFITLDQFGINKKSTGGVFKS